MRRLLLVVLFLAIPALGGTFTVFPQRDFVRSTAAPAPELVTFTVVNPAIGYVLRVVNGGATGNLEKVTGAIVKLNGVEILGTSDFNGKTPPTIEKPVTLLASNELSVELRGNPGSGATIAILGVDNDLPTITATVTPAPNADGWNRDIVKVTFTCADATSAVVTCSAPIDVTAEGRQTVTGSATDLAGNTATKNVVVSIDKTAPSVAIASPADGTALGASSANVSGSVTDPLSGIASVTCNGLTATVSASSFNCSAALTAGSNFISVLAIDRAGNETPFGVNVISDTTPPSIVIGSPAAGSTTNVATLAVTGTVSDDDQVVSVEIGGRAATLSGTAFSGAVALVDGANAIPVKAVDRAGNVRTISLPVTRFALPAIAISTPADLATLRDAAITVSGTVADATSVEVNGISASISNGTFSASGIALAQGRTVVTATATAPDGAVATSTILVYRDSIPPRVVLRYPVDGMIVYQPSIDVAGMVDDIVVGTINSAQMSVTVNGVRADVANRAFVAHGVTLTPGFNTLSVVGTDQGGNSATVTATVKYDNTAQSKITVVSGNDQSGVVGTMLTAPIVVKVTDHGAPVSGKVVAFEVVENNGVLTGTTGTGHALTATTDNNGLASMRWTLGSRAGAGNNRVSAVSAGIPGMVEFSATGRNGVPAQIVVDSGDAQYGAVGTRLSRPLVAIVIDEGKNRLAGVPVTFSVLKGEGSFDGQQQVTVNSDSDGRAWATPTLGAASINTFQVSVAGISKGAAFQSFGKVAAAPDQTSISGVILDNTDLAVPGVSVRIEGTNLVTQANAQGQFSIPQAPVGYVKLIIDGSTSLRPGTWPTLEYAMYTISGADNTLEMPIHILPLDVRRGLFVDETTGGTLTLPELPGFSLTIKPGSATFPGGGRTGIVSVTMVHADKVPMSPGFGQQPRFIVTIQPPGVHFDPPAPMTFPNVDGLAPGQVTEMYSFDHDLGQFVSIGTASVSSDGMQIRSDPGVGIIKGGWHCGSDPSAQGTAADCPTCQRCENFRCLNYTGHELRSSNADSECCSGTFYSLTSNCCGGPQPSHLVGKRFTGFTDCPTWTQDWKSKRNQNIFDYNGCSIPGVVTDNPNNPAYGQYTELSGVATYGKYEGPPNSKYQLPCDKHDECYQECHPNAKGSCDERMYDQIMSVCNYAQANGEDPTTVQNCIKWAWKVREGLRLGGLLPFENNQKASCLCCNDSVNQQLAP